MTVSISIDGNSLRILNASGKKVDKWDNVSFDSHLVKDGLITDAAQMGQTIKEALKERHLSTKNVRWSLPSIGSASQIVTLPQGSKAKTEVLVQREARRTLSVSPETSYLNWQLLPKVGTEQQAYVVASPRELIRTLLETCKIAGVSIGSIDLKALALARAVGQENAIIADGEANSVEIIIMLGSIPSLMRGVWIREKDLDTGRVSALLLQQLASTIEYHNDMSRSTPLPSDVPVYLTGEAALNPELAQRVNTLSSRTVASLEPPLTYPEHFPLSLYMTNIGLTLK